MQTSSELGLSLKLIDTPDLGVSSSLSISFFLNAGNVVDSNVLLQCSCTGSEIRFLGILEGLAISFRSFMDKDRLCTGLVSFCGFVIIMSFFGGSVLQRLNVSNR